MTHQMRRLGRAHLHPISTSPSFSCKRPPRTFPKGRRAGESRFEVHRKWGSGLLEGFAVRLLPRGDPRVELLMRRQPLTKVARGGGGGGGEKRRSGGREETRRGRPRRTARGGRGRGGGATGRGAGEGMHRSCTRVERRHRGRSHREGNGAKRRHGGRRKAKTGHQKGRKVHWRMPKRHRACGRERREKGMRRTFPSSSFLFCLFPIIRMARRKTTAMARQGWKKKEKIPRRERRGQCDIVWGSGNAKRIVRGSRTVVGGRHRVRGCGTGIRQEGPHWRPARSLHSRPTMHRGTSCHLLNTTVFHGIFRRYGTSLRDLL